MVKEFRKIYGGTVRFTLALMLPLINVIANAFILTIKDIHIGFLTLNFSYLILTLLTLLFMLFLDRFVLKVKSKKNSKYVRSSVILYLILVLSSIIPNSSGGMPIFLIPFFTAYVVNLATNSDKFNF